MKFRFSVDDAFGGTVNSARTHASSTRFWMFSAVALIGATAAGCGDDTESSSARPDAGEQSSSTHAVPTASADGGRGDTSGDSAAIQPTALESTSNPDTTDSGATATPGTDDSTTDSGATESGTPPSNSVDFDATSDLPPGEGRLNGLTASGALTPAFDVDVHEYDVTLPVFSTHLVLTAELEPGGALEVDGTPFGAGGVWTSGPLDLGTTQLTMTWERADGVVQTYIINAHRAESTREYVGVPYSAPPSDGAVTALSRDGNTLAVGSYTGSTGSEGPRIYVRSGDEWSFETQLQIPNPPEDGEGGWVFELNADGTTLVAGARSVSRVYVFQKSASGWEATAELAGRDEDDNIPQMFGDKVTINDAGDVIAVGTSRRHVPDGAVYVFQKSDGNWEQRARLAPSVQDEPTEYGIYCNAYNTELALNARGTTLAVANGALSFSCEGSVEVYENQGANWAKTSVLEEGETGARGMDVDMDADGKALVVASGDTWSVYAKSTQGWVEQARISRSTYSVLMTDAGDMVVTDDAVFVRSPNGWLLETPLPEPKAVRPLAYTALSMSNDGSTVALGSHVYSARPALWAQVAEPPAGNTNCRERTHEIEGACLYELACDAERVEATCDVNEDGSWRCGCYGAEQGELREYTVTGADASSVCRLTAMLCVEGNQLASETACSREITTGAISCYELETCLTTFDLGGGVQAVGETVDRTLGCSTDYKGDVYCECGESSYFEPDAETYAVFGTEAALGCALFKGVCEGTVELGQESDCAEPRVDVSDDYGTCSSKRTCGVRTPLDESGSVYALSSTFNSEVTCHNWNTGDECECGTFNTYGAGTVVVDSTRLNTSCRVADAVCHGVPNLDVGEAFECVATDSDVEGDHCTASADCGLALQFDGTSATATESVDVECTQTGNDGWACECARGWNDHHQFSVAAGGSGNACDLAAVQCIGIGTPFASTP